MGVILGGLVRVFWGWADVGVVLVYFGVWVQDFLVGCWVGLFSVRLVGDPVFVFFWLGVGGLLGLV